MTDKHPAFNAADRDRSNPANRMIGYEHPASIVTDRDRAFSVGRPA